MTILVVYSLCQAALFYLGSRALITRAIWSRYPTQLAAFMDCSACTGFWYACALTQTLGRFEVGLPFGNANDPLACVLVGLLGIATTPIAAGIMQRGFDSLGSITPDA